MKRFKYIVSLMLLLCFAACNSSDSTDAELEEGTNLLISGKIIGASGQKVFLEATSQNGTISLAETVVENNTFELKTSIPGLGIYQLRVGDAPDNAILLTALPNDQIKVTGEFVKFPLNAKISGVDWGADYGKYMALIADFSNEQQGLMNLQGTVPQEELVKKYMALKAPLDKYAREKINANPSSSFNIVLSNSLMPAAGFVDYPLENLEALKKMASSYEQKHADSPITKTLLEQVLQIESGYKEYQIIASGKKPAPEIVMESPEGKTIKLSSLKGKVVLVDFWASWCKPCRDENPNVVKLYNKYKNKGFTVYSVSLDGDMAPWVAAIEADGLIWPNHVSDLKGWKTFVTTLYGFSSIPHTVLVGKDGNIIAVGLRGQALEEKVAEILN